MWTKEKPTQEGWYWYTEGNLELSMFREPQILKVIRTRGGHLYADGLGAIARSKGCWKGPIEAPEGPDENR